MYLPAIANNCKPTAFNRIYKIKFHQYANMHIHGNLRQKPNGLCCMKKKKKSLQRPKLLGKLHKMLFAFSANGRALHFIYMAGTTNLSDKKKRERIKKEEALRNCIAIEKRPQAKLCEQREGLLEWERGGSGMSYI